MVIRTILVGTLYWLSMGRASYFISFAFRKSVVLGMFIGLVYGDVQTGPLCSATTQLMCMGDAEAGGNIPSDRGLATCIAIPATVVNNLGPATAVALAVPFGVLGVLINNTCHTINSFYNTKADRFVEGKQYDELSIFSFVLLWFINGVLYFTPVFITALFDSSVVQTFTNVIPGWTMNRFTNAGNTLLGLGFALTLVVMGKEKCLPFFAPGFFLYPAMGFSMLIGVVIALCPVLIVSLFKQNGEEEVT